MGPSGLRSDEGSRRGGAGPSWNRKSSKPEGGYDKKTQAQGIRAVVTEMGYDKTFVVAHDIGNMVAYAYAAMYPDKVERLVVMDVPIPGIDP